MAETKPRVLILGGSGFIGRHLVSYLFNNKLVSRVCVSDKVPFQIAGLSAEEREIYENKDFLTFKQADLASETHVAKVFEHDGGHWNYVVNLAAATKYSQGKEVYDVNIVNVAKLCSEASAKSGVKRFIQVSTAQVYDPPKKAPATEESKLKPWTDIARAHAEAEDAVRKVNGLNFVIVRPAIVYGRGDVAGLTPRLMTGSVYRESGQKMTTLYTKDMQVNTVHVDDVAKALWFLLSRGESGSVWNLADPSNTSQGKLNSALEELYGIRTSFLNALKMKAAETLGTKFLVGFVNDMHLKPFSDAMKKYGVQDTPLTPYLDEELIKDTDTWVNGRAITDKLGFQYDHQEVTAAALKQVLLDYVAKGFFPKELTVPGSGANSKANDDDDD